MAPQDDPQSLPSKCYTDSVGFEGKKEKWHSDIPARYILAALGFSGCVVQYTLNVCLSVAIVVMVKPLQSKQHGTIDLKVKENHTVEDLDKVTTACPTVNANGSFMSSCHNQMGEFSWDEETQGHVLAAYYYGYVATQLMGGRLSETLGAKIVYGTGIMLSGGFTMMGPVALRANFYAFIAIRVLTGAASGVAIPALHVMFAKWFPPRERAKISGIIFSATNVGSLLSMSLSGVVAEYGGWPLVFYFFGAFTVVWFIPWLLLAYNSPHDHPRISPEEKMYIISELDAAQKKGSASVPWGGILTSRAVWAALGMSCSMTWLTFTLLTEMPTYCKNILQFDITQSGLISALPYLSTWISSITCGFLSQWLRAQGYVSHLGAYWIFNGVGWIVYIEVSCNNSPPGEERLQCLTCNDWCHEDCSEAENEASCGSAVSLLMITLSGHNTTAIVILLVITLTTRGAFFGGSYLNHVDLGYNYAGTLSGMTYTLANSAGIFSPLVTGFLTQGQQTLLQWQYVFYVSIGVVTIPYITYLIYGSVEEQPWNRPRKNLNETTHVTHL